MHRFALAFFLAAAGCADIQTVASSRQLYSPEQYSQTVTTMVAREDKNDPRRYWLDNAVRPLEAAVAVGDSELPLACMRSPLNGTYVKKGEPTGEDLFSQDRRYYDMLVKSHNALAGHSAKLLALMQVADGEFGHKDEYKELALRAVVAYERLLDRHRFLLAQLDKTGCLSAQAPNSFVFTPEARGAYDALLKQVKASADMTGDLTSMANASFTKYAQPLSQRRAYAKRLELLSFLHRIYSEQSAEAEQACGQYLTAAQPDPVRLYACGYLYERLGRDDEAKRAYSQLKSVSSGNLDLTSRAKKRLSYIDDWNATLGASSPQQCTLVFK